MLLIGSATQSGVAYRSLPPRRPEEDFARRRTAPDFTELGGDWLEIRVVAAGDSAAAAGLLTPVAADGGVWASELPPARLSRSFARTPRGVRHWPECRCIFHSASSKRHIAAIE